MATVPPAEFEGCGDANSGMSKAIFLLGKPVIWGRGHVSERASFGPAVSAGRQGGKSGYNNATHARPLPEAAGRGGPGEGLPRRPGGWGAAAAPEPMQKDAEREGKLKP